jgi:hypothetical protein
MKVLCYSSFTFGYLNRARVLFQSVKNHHPDWHCVALITDEPPPGFEWRSDEPMDEVVYASDLGIPDFRGWLFKHDIVEVCTAVKGPYAFQACSLGYDAVIYMDPDTCVFSPLESVLKALETSDIALTPHQLKPDKTRQAVIDNEITSLKTGIYNLGFLAIRTSGEGRRMAQWWNDRLLSFCYDDILNGLFVDQRWCDHVPGFFDKVAILRDPGLNVASWNLSNRVVAVDREGIVRVNGSKLGFWHFTKLGKVGDTMTRRYAGQNFQVYELWAWYRKQVEAATSKSVPGGYWAFGQFDSGIPIPKAARELYRHRVDLQQAFGDPYKSGSGSFEEWLRNEGMLVPEQASVAA